MIKSICQSRAAVMLALGIACWPVLRWYVVRLSDGSDEPWGLAALATALLFAPRHGWLNLFDRTKLKLLCVGLVVYAASYNWLPPLGHALLFATLLAISVKEGRFPLSWWGLLVLSLPLIATLQFYLGYPLRLATTQLCVPLLKLGGVNVTAEATALHWAGETVIVDAPCSGIHMLWTGLFLAAGLACWQKLDFCATRRLLQRASLTVFLANVLRAAALFCIEARIWPSPAWAHEGMGLLLFGLAAAVICFASSRRSQVEGVPLAPL